MLAIYVRASSFLPKQPILWRPGGQICLGPPRRKPEQIAAGLALYGGFGGEAGDARAGRGYGAEVIADRVERGIVGGVGHLLLAEHDELRLGAVERDPVADRGALP